MIAFISRTSFSKDKWNTFKIIDKLHPCLQHGFIRSMENVILTKIENAVGGTTVITRASLLHSLKLKNIIKTPKSYIIIQKAERQLMYEQIRYINNNTELCVLG